MYKMSDSFTIRIPEESDYSAIIDIIFDDFFPRERLSVASGRAKERTNKQDVEFRQRFETWLSDGISLIAIDRDSNKLAGVAINFIAKKDLEEDHKEYSSRSMKALMTFVEKLERAFDVFSASKIAQGMELCFLCVKEDYSGQGLGRKLIQKSIELAQSHNLGFVQSIPTAAATIHLFEDLLFDTKSEMNLKDYQLPDGLPGFPFALDNDVARYVVKLL